MPRSLYLKIPCRKRIDILFEGIYMNSDVWLNGIHLGNHPYGYTSFHYDITDHLYFDGTPNRLVVEVKNEGANCRWYSGSGIYRHVWITATSPVHVKRWGTYISTLNASSLNAEVQVETELSNHLDGESEVILELEVIDINGGVVARAASEIS